MRNYLINNYKSLTITINDIIIIITDIKFGNKILKEFMYMKESVGNEKQ